MDDAVHDAFVDLKRSVDKQIQVQGYGTTKALISTLRETAQALADFQEVLSKNK